MIILDEEDQHTKLNDVVVGLTLRLPEKVAGRSSPFLPDYETSEARHKTTLRDSSSRKRIDSRFWRAVFYALVIYVVLSAVIGIPIILLKSSKKSNLQGQDPHPDMWVDDGSNSAVPLNLANAGPWTLGETTTCSHWSFTHDDHSNGSFTASVQRTLSSSGSFFVRSNASHNAANPRVINGSLDVLINPDAKATEAIFQVQLLSSSSELRSKTFACFNNTGSVRGLSIYVFRNLTNLDYLSLDVRLLFPQQSSHPNIENFVTYLPWFSQHFGDLKNATIFDQVVVEGAGREIVCNSLHASKISVKSSLAPISGTFNTTQSLNVDNVKGTISANITLVNNATSQNPTFLTLDTGDSGIDARVTLLAPSKQPSSTSTRPPAFVAHVKTFNGPLSLDVAYHRSTTSIPLQLFVQNNLAVSNVSVDAKYEGTFEVQTKLAQVVVREGGFAADPSGKKRERHIVYDENTGTVAQGWVGWGPRPVYKDGAVHGDVNIVSSLSPVLLQLGCGP